MVADGTLLAVLVRNLVDNAVRYSPAGARVRVSVQRQAGRVVLRVRGQWAGGGRRGAGAAGPAFLPPRRAAETGSGLGWSIVRRIAEVQRMDIEIGTSTALGGLAVRVSIPAASEPNGG